MRLCRSINGPKEKKNDWSFYYNHVITSCSSQRHKYDLISIKVWLPYLGFAQSSDGTVLYAFFVIKCENHFAEIWNQLVWTWN